MRSRRKFAWLLLFLVAVTAGGIWYFLNDLRDWPQRWWNRVTHESAAQIEDVRRVIVGVLKVDPQITVRDRVVNEAAQRTLDVILVVQPVDVSRELDSSWLGSTKHLRIRARFMVKAGFDLLKPTDVHVDGSTVRIKVPSAEILSVEPANWNVEVLQDGLWNKIQAEDVQREMEALSQMARSQQAGLPAQAQQALINDLSSKLAPLGYEVEVEFQPVTPRM